MNMEQFKNKARELIAISYDVAYEESATEYNDGFSMTFCLMDGRRIAISYNKYWETWKGTLLESREYVKVW